MTDEEKRLFREMYPRMVEGWKVAELDRYRDLKNWTTESGILAMASVMNIVTAQEPNPSSGLIEFARLMKLTAANEPSTSPTRFALDDDSVCYAN